MAVIQSGVSTDVLTVDPTSKAARVTLYNPDGTPQVPGVLASYMAATPTFTPPAAPTDVFTISGSATKLVKIFRIYLVTTQTTAGINSWSLVKRSTANSVGTFSIVGAVRSDNNDPADTAIVRSYTVNPTLGALVGTVWSGFIGAPASPAIPGPQEGLAGLIGSFVDFTTELGKPIILRSPADVLAWSFEGAARPTGLAVRCSVRWTEE